MFVVLDSNIWISEDGLKSALAAEALKFIRSEDATLVVPEVVKLEIEIKLRERLLSHRQKAESSLRYLSSYFSGMVSVVDQNVLPTNDEIVGCVRNIIRNAGVETREMPLTIEAAKRSFDKILLKLQPSSKGKEQFTDGVIWANCVELLEEADVYLVSNDKAFYKDENFDLGLAPNLAEEAAGSSNELQLFRGLKNMLQGPSQDVQRVVPSEELDHAANTDTEANPGNESSWLPVKRSSRGRI